MDHCDEIPDVIGQINYLERVLKEHKQWRLNEGISGKPKPIETKDDEILSSNDEVRIAALQEQQRRFARNLKSEIDYRKGLLSRSADVGARSHEEPNEATAMKAEFTTARQVLAIHYLLKYSKADRASNADIARFIEFLTSKNYKNIYKKVCNPLGSRDKELNEDLRFVRSFFEKLGLTEIVRMINNEISSGSL
jgi:hypothetical protein